MKRRTTAHMRVATGLALCTFLLGGCMGAGIPFIGQDAGAPDVAETSFAQTGDKAPSEILNTLLARQSALAEDDIYGQVAQAALDTGARSAEADLRVAKLRAQAENKNWLPSLDPFISLSSLGKTAAGLLINHAIYDNGLRKAEREYAAADVEVAAVTLSEDVNERVYTALSLYVAVQKGEQQRRAGEKALSGIAPLKRLVTGRVKGGVSDKGEQRVVESKVLEIRSMTQAATEAGRVARAELTAMTGQEWAASSDSAGTSLDPVGFETLQVLRAQAEANRSIAQAKALRAGQLPGLNASAKVGDGKPSGSLDISAGGFGFGMRDRLKSIETSKEAATRQVAEAQEAAARKYSRSVQRLSSLKRKEVEAQKLLKDSRGLYQLFREQLRSGQRSTVEVANAYGTMVQRQFDVVDVQHDILLLQFEMARDHGLLADGDKI